VVINLFYFFYVKCLAQWRLAQLHSGRLSFGKVTLSNNSNWVNRRSVRWTIALTLTAPTWNIIPVSTCPRLSFICDKKQRN